MSCQQASRLISTSATITTTTTTTVNTIATPKAVTAVKANANNVVTTSPAKANAVSATSPEDPYVFTDTVSSTPPILFNTQKLRVRANEAQHKNNFYIKQAAATAAVAAATTTATTTVAAAAATRVTVNTKAGIVNTKATPLALLHGDSAAANGVAVGAALKAQASLPIAATTTILQQQQTTTNFNNVTQSHKQQQQQLQQQQQHKRATNICIVRPQLQQQQQQQQQEQQQQQKQKQQKHSITVTPAATSPQPPPLYTHTPSLWQTPLLLDTAVAATPTTTAAAATVVTAMTPTHTQPPPQQQQKPLMLPIAAAAITPPLSVSPPTSPASLPSPNASATPTQPCLLTYTAVAQGTAATATIPTATATAMVAPIIATAAAATPSVVVVAASVAGQPLPPSKFHHTTLAQHLQKVECLKKPKRALPLANVNVNNNNIIINNNNNNNNNHIYIESSKPALKLLTQPPPLKAFDTLSLTATVLQQARQQQQTHQNHHPQQQQHSADDDTDLSEIPVNVIFRKPVASEMSGAVSERAAIVAVHVDNSPKNMRIIPNNMVMTTVSPLTPPTPPTLCKLFTQTKPPHSQQQQPHPPALVTQHGTALMTTKSMAPIIKSVVMPHQQQPQQQLQQQQQQQQLAKQSQQQQQQLQEKKKQQPLQMSSTAATTKRKTQAAGSKNNTNKKNQSSNSNNNKKQHLLNVSATEAIPTVTSAAAVTPTANAKLIAGQVELKQPQQQQKQNDNITTVNQQKLTVVTVPAYKTNTNSSNNRISATTTTTTTATKTLTVSSYTSPIVDRPYCVQRHWLHAGELSFSTAKSSGNGREERIAEHKSLLRRHALQLLATQSLQELPLTLARQRLQSVDRMLRKAQLQRHKDLYDIPAKKCLFPNCSSPTVTMSAHCLRHIVNNTSQQIFAPCVAKFSNGQPCREPVFDLLHDLALCVEHKRLRNEYELQRKQTTAMLVVRNVSANQQQQLQQQQQQVQQRQLKLLQQQQQRVPITTTVTLPTTQVSLTAATAIAKPNNQQNVNLNGVRKRKHNIGTNIVNGINPVGRPQKRNKKLQLKHQQLAANTNAAVTTFAAGHVGASGALLTPATLPPISAVLQRKNSTTSLESIASNSQSSSSQAHYAMASTPNQSKSAATTTTTTTSTASIVSMPALAPLSNTHNASPLTFTKHDSKMISGDICNNGNYSSNGNFGNLNMMINANYKADDIHNQMSAQFTATGMYNNNNNNSHFNNNMNFNGNFLNSFSGNGIGSSNNLLTNNTDELLTQDMFSICENSSAYASSEDTGLGGLSESELIGSHDADDIPLGDTRLLEEHDLANVFSTLPVDAFNELFTSVVSNPVRQDECDEMDRQLELADKDIKCLQQSIGSDSDFLGDFLDVNDDILADTAADICSKMDIVSSVMNSPDTSGIDAATLFVDSNGGGGGGSNSGGGEFHVTENCPTVADIRGLVQT